MPSMRTRFWCAAVIIGVVDVSAAGCQSQSGRGAHHAASQRSPTGAAAPTGTVRSGPNVIAAAPSTTTTLPPGPLAPVIDHVKTTARVVFITIDDGYTRDPRIITLVHSLHLPITAFVIRGPALAGRPYWRALQAAGATIEDHTITHPNLRLRNLAEQQHEICSPIDDYAKWFGDRPTLIRPPYGDYDSRCSEAADGSQTTGRSRRQWSIRRRRAITNRCFRSSCSVPSKRASPGATASHTSDARSSPCVRSFAHRYRRRPGWNSSNRRPMAHSVPVRAAVRIVW